MPWVLAVVVGIVSAVAGAAFSIAASDIIIKAYRISSFEGASGYFVMLVLVPIGLLVGFVTGFVLTRWGAPHGGAMIGLQFLIAPLATAGLLTLGYAVAYAGAQRPPKIDGHTLTLELELRFPAGITRPGDLVDEGLRLSLYATDKDNAFVDLKSDQVSEVDGRYVVAAEASLNSISARRVALVYRRGEEAQVYDLKLKASPSRADTTWTDWGAAVATGGHKLPAAGPYELRYRVRID